MIRNILTVLSGEAGAPDALGAGFSLARQFGARLEVLHVAADPREAVTYLGEGMTGGLVEQMMRAVEEENASRAKNARAAFDQALERVGKGVESSYLTRIGAEDTVAAQHARLADLTVLARPGDSAQGRITLEAVLMGSGRPVLLIPPGAESLALKAAAIAWNGSAEAARALALATPVLDQCHRVIVLGVGEHEEIDSGVASLVESLKGRAFAVESRILPKGKGPVGETLMGAARGAAADCLVMGGYGHSRAREFIFGGATADILGGATLPVFLAH